MSASEWAQSLLSSASERARFFYHGSTDVATHHRISWQQTAYIGNGTTRIACMPSMQQDVQRIFDAELPGCRLPLLDSSLNSHGVHSTSPSRSLCGLVERLYPEDVRLWQSHCASTSATAENHPAVQMLNTLPAATGGSGSCLVFHSQHKSAGHTIVQVLTHEPLRASGLTRYAWANCDACRHRCDARNWDYAADTCSSVASVPTDPRAAPLRLLTHGGALSLATSPAWSHRSGCMWTTTFREPISRLVSSLFYCRAEVANRPLEHVDSLCAANHLDPRNATVREWAAHWGNYLLRELLQHPDLSPLARPAARAVPVTPPWYNAKQRLAGADSTETAAGRANLAAVHRRLAGTGEDAPLFSAIGLAERWEESCAVFDRAMPLREGSWLNATGRWRDSHGSEAYAAEEEAALAAARSDAVVRARLDADLSLYEHARTLFEAQLTDLHITPPTRPSDANASSAAGAAGAARAAGAASSARGHTGSPVAVMIAMDLRVPSSQEFFDEFNAYTAGTDVFVCTDRMFAHEASRLDNVVLTAYAEDDGGIPAELQTSSRANLIQWWRLQQCYAHVVRHSAATGHNYSFVFKMRTDISIQRPIMAMYADHVRPFESAQPPRAYIATDWIFGGEPRVMAVLASLIDSWQDYSRAAFGRQYMPVDGGLLLGSDWSAGKLDCLTLPQEALRTDMGEPYVHRSNHEPTVSDDTNLRELLLKDRLDMYAHDSARRPYAIVNLCGDNGRAFSSERSIVLHLLTNGVLIRALDGMAPAVKRFDSPLRGAQKPSLLQPHALIPITDGTVGLSTIELDELYEPFFSTDSGITTTPPIMHSANVSMRVRELAASFDAPSCVAARASANRTQWQRSNFPRHSRGLEWRQQLYTLKSRRVMYVRNQKAASRFLTQWLPFLFNVSESRPTWGDNVEPIQTYLEPYREVSAPTASASWLDSYLTFTIVREPFAMVKDSYLEISNRNQSVNAGANSVTVVPDAPFRAMPCTNSKEATERFLAFLHAARRGEPLGTEFFHAYPQALKVDAVPRGTRSFDAIGVMESLETDLNEIRALAGLDYTAMPQETPIQAHSHADEGCANVDPNDERVQRTLCEMYRADYVCFGYAAPPACRAGEAAGAH